MFIFGTIGSSKRGNAFFLLGNAVIDVTVSLNNKVIKMFDFVCDVIGSAVDAVVENPLKSIAVVTATVATGGLALAAAPAVGAAASVAGLGVAGGTLSGAAASSAGLAALGGGSVAAGGAGMAGGAAVVAATGATTGAVVSSAVVKRNS